MAHDEEEATVAGKSGVVNKAPDYPIAAPRTAPIANPLFEYLLRLGDDRLVLGHRLSEWCGHGPILEEDIALSNMALDLIGHATSLLALAGTVEGQGRDEDALAFFRDGTAYRNALLVEQPNGDFAVTMVRQFLFDAHSVLLWDQLSRASHPELAAIAAKSLKEDKYHLRHSSEWIVRLGDGTDESHARTQRALDTLWRYTAELFDHDAVNEAVAAHGITVDTAALRALWDGLVNDVLQRATLTRPADEAPQRRGGRRGMHSEHLGHMLATMQSVARAHPGASW
ncbi:1,2-phenylacetyl-CoA epoxidase subunit PaaC [Gemmatimonas sp.]|uniref:1,2-phenylacetyl-CoA epoxidase subunit PaaC n=1 Tax=Gemmatimonas sp. TaxID=1962908 RepID=UPI00333ED35E